MLLGMANRKVRDRRNWCGLQRAMHGVRKRPYHAMAGIASLLQAAPGPSGVVVILRAGRAANQVVRRMIPRQALHRPVGRSATRRSLLHGIW